MGSFWQRLANTPRSIAKGLRVTLTALRRTKTTVAYPEKVPTPAGQNLDPKDPRDAFARPYEIAPRYRGLHGLTRNPETGDVNCIGCMACANVCPDHLISMDLEKRDGHSGRYPVTFTVNIGPCCFCGLCSEVCPTPFRAIVMTDLYEWASYERFGSNLALSKDDLLRNGDYEVARRAAGRTFTEDGEIASINPEEEGNPYFQFAAETGKGKKKPAAAAEKPAVAKPAADDPRVDVPKAALAGALPPKAEPAAATAEAAAPAPAKAEATPEELRAKLVDLLTAGGLAVPEAPEEITLEALEGIEDRKQRSLAKVARRRLRSALGLGE